MRIAIAGFEHETNTFAPVKADYQAFAEAKAYPPLVKSDEMLQMRLQSDYSNLFNNETEWISNGDLNQIDMTCFTFGLPAFVIHGLAECRELFMSQNPSESDGLWPVK